MGAAEFSEPAFEDAAIETEGELLRNAAAATTKLVMMPTTRNRRERFMASS
jgi:hypothetical protein